MKIAEVLFLLFAVLAHEGIGQPQYRYGLTPQTFDDYQRAIAADNSKELIDLESFIDDIVLDIRYATINNFTGERVYEEAKAYARRPVAEALRRVQEKLKSRGLGLKIYDAYRPYRATVRFYEIYGDTTYVASPYRGSRHNRGCAIDLTLIDLGTGKELRMPTGYDDFSRAAWPSTAIADPQVRRNRALLIEVMSEEGFRVNSSEWWHFDFRGWGRFEILDIEFSELN